MSKTDENSHFPPMYLWTKDGDKITFTWNLVTGINDTPGKTYTVSTICPYLIELKPND